MCMQVAPPVRPPMPLLYKQSWGTVKPTGNKDSIVSPFCMQAGVGFDATPGPEERAAGRPQHGGISILKDAPQPEPSLDIPGLLGQWGSTCTASGTLRMNSTRLPSFDLGWASRSSCLLPDIALSWTPSQALPWPSSPPVAPMASPRRSPPGVAMQQQGHHHLSTQLGGASPLGGRDTKMGLRYEAPGLSPLSLGARLESFPTLGDAADETNAGIILINPPDLGQPEEAGGEREAGGEVPGVPGLDQGLGSASRMQPGSGLPPLSEPHRHQQGWRKRSGFGGLFPRNQSGYLPYNGASQGLPFNGASQGVVERTMAIQRDPSLQGGQLVPPFRAPTPPAQSPAQNVTADATKVAMDCQPNTLSLKSAQAPQKGPPVPVPALPPYPGAWGSQLYPGALVPSAWVDYTRSGYPNLFSTPFLPPSAITTGFSNTGLPALHVAGARRPPGAGGPSERPQAPLGGVSGGALPYAPMKAEMPSVKPARDGDGGDGAAPARVMSPSWSSSNQTRPRPLQPQEQARETAAVSTSRTPHLTPAKPSPVSFPSSRFHTVFIVLCLVGSALACGPSALCCRSFALEV